MSKILLGICFVALVASVFAGYSVPGRRWDSGSGSSEERDRINVKCEHNATFVARVDGNKITVNCGTPVADTAGATFADRCIGCCTAWGFANDHSAEDTVGFVGANGISCVCCRRRSNGKNDRGNRRRYF